MFKEGKKVYLVYFFCLISFIIHNISLSSSVFLKKINILSSKKKENILYNFCFDKKIKIIYNYYYLFNLNKLKLIFILNNLNIINKFKKLFFSFEKNNLIKLIYFSNIKYKNFSKFVLFFDLNFNFRVNYILVKNYFSETCLNIFFSKKLFWGGKKLLLIKKKRINKFKFNIAIDPGHGGFDPGAVGVSGIKEKNIVLSISNKLLNLINVDKKYHAFLIRNSDYYVSFRKRFYIARKKNADFIISIHTDSVSNRKVYGASVWVSDHGFKMNYINEVKKIYNKNVNLNNYFFLNSNILNSSVCCLGHWVSFSSYISYNIALNIINELHNVISLRKFVPQYSNLIILSSFDIPSILIETGYISNFFEEKKLSSKIYQDKIAKYIYIGINNFINKYVGLSFKKK